MGGQVGPRALVVWLVCQSDGRSVAKCKAKIQVCMVALALSSHMLLLNHGGRSLALINTALASMSLGLGLEALSRWKLKLVLATHPAFWFSIGTPYLISGYPISVYHCSMGNFSGPTILGTALAG